MLEEYISIDLETTGLSPKRDSIIEIGGVHFREGEVVGQFSTLVRPKSLLPSRIEKLTGITTEMTVEAPSFSEIQPDLMDFLGDLPLAGHNIIFDYSFLKKEFVNEGLPFEKTGIDTLKLCRKLLPSKQKKNLAAVCQYFEIPDVQYHRALADAMNTGLVLEKLKQCYLMADGEYFEPELLNYTIKREQKIQIRQKQYLIDFAKWHKINVPVDIDHLTRSEASRLLDQWIAEYGRRQ